MVVRHSRAVLDALSAATQFCDELGIELMRGSRIVIELVQELYLTLRSRPELEVRWVAAHSGIRWNEYADALATAYRRKVR